MSKLLSGRVKVTLSVLGAVIAILFIPASAGASTCGVMAKSFHCLTGAPKKKALIRKARVEKRSAKKRPAKKSYKVAAARPTTLNDAGSSARVVKPTRKSSKKARRKVRRKARRGKKVRTSKRRVRKKRSSRRHKKSFRKNKSLRTVGRRHKAKASRRLSKRSSKKSWRARSKGLGYRVAHRGVSTRCFPARLKKLLRKVSAHYGRKLVITSGYRSHRHNRRIGGARRSQHIRCTAADFYVPGVNKYALARYLKSLPGRGGVGTYAGNRIVHLDIGPRRSWHWGGRKKRRFAKKRRTKRYSSKRRYSRKRYVRARFRGSKS